MSALALMFIIFALMRLRARRRWYRRAYYWGWWGPPWMMQRPVQLGYAGRAPSSEPVRAAPLPPPDPFETLKSRYVRGDLTDDEYERELDALLKTPEGRRTLR